MEKIIKESYIYKFIIMCWNWINKTFKNSFFINIFLKQNNKEDVVKESILYKIFNWVINIFRKIFKKLKLDKLLENSIFTKPMIWITFVVMLTPFIPTMAVLLLVLLSLGSLFLKVVLDENFKFQYSKMNIWVILFVIVYAFSAMTSLSLTESRNIFLLTATFILFYFVVINSVTTKKQINLLLYVFIIGATIASLYGLYQYVFGDVYAQAWLDSNMFEDIKMRVYSTFENPNVFGEYLLLVVPVITALLFTEKGWKKKIVLLAMLGINGVALILTFSRGCWLGILFGIAILAVVIDRRFILLGIALLLMAPFILPESIINRFMSIGNMGDSSTSYRVFIWMGTIAMLKDYWISGVGLGITSFNKVYPVYSYNNIAAPHSHNLYLQLVVEHGIIGLIVFVGIIYNFFKETIISAYKKRNLVLVGIISGVLAFLVQSMTDHTWYNYRVVLIFWMVLAFGISLAKLNQEEN